jgi:uncharacterized protein YbaP (TraB family)
VPLRFPALFVAPLLALTTPACAQTPAPTATDADPALWVVKDQDTTIYLFGTIHVLKPGLTWFDEGVKAAFDKSQTLVLEMVEPDAATQQKVVTAKAFDPAAPALSTRIQAKYRGTFETAMNKTGLPQTAWEKMQPWFAAVTLSLLPVQEQGYEPANGPEKVLTDAARAQGKTVEGLETFEGQLSIFDTLSKPAQVQLLESTLDELPKSGETMAKMVADWSRGDPDALAAEMNDSLKDSPEVAKALLTDRNKRWAAWIANRMKTPGTVFVAVGAGHLAGPESVQKMLGAYKLKAVRVKY